MKQNETERFIGKHALIYASENRIYAGKVSSLGNGEVEVKGEHKKFILPISSIFYMIETPRSMRYE